MIPLLSSCVPDLKLDCCVVQADGLCEEGRSNCALLVLVELTLDEAEDEAGFAHCRLPSRTSLN